MFRPIVLLGLVLVSTSAPAQTINVEIDYMQDANHSHMPQPGEIAAVVQMFACHGITLNVVVDDALTEVSNLQCPGGGGSFFGCSGSGTYKEIKDANFDHGNGWHYCVFGHSYNGTNSSGLAEIGGDDLLVTLSSGTSNNGNPFSRAATFAHELGHNLGLLHASPESSGSPGNFQVNYASVMSYQYQFGGVRSQMECTGLVDNASLFKDLDYSNGLLPDLNEAALSETIGVGIHNVDWDCDSTLDAGTVNQELDLGIPWCATSGPVNVLRDHNDWANIDDNAKSPQFDTSKTFEVATCGPDPFLDQNKDLDNPGLCFSPPPTLVTESCSAARMVWVDLNHSGAEDGSGSKPYDDLWQAVAATTTGSVLYLQPGTYTNGGATVRLDVPRIFAGPGGVVITR